MNITEREQRVAFIKERLKEQLHPLEKQATWAHLKREEEALEAARRQESAA